MRLLLFFIFILTITNSSSQNLVPNPSFEDTTCVTGGEWWDVPFFFGSEHWFNPNLATPDYFGIEDQIENCGLYSIYTPSLLNAGEWQYPRTGSKMAALWAGDGISCTREFVEIELNSELLSDSIYCVSFYLSLGNRQMLATDGFGVHFSQDSLLNIESGCWLKDYTKLAVERNF